jgi:thiol:disulfide interchange protein DsbD
MFSLKKLMSAPARAALGGIAHALKSAVLALRRFARVPMALASLLLGFLLAGGAAAADGPVRVEAVEVELVAEHDAVRAGSPLSIGLRIAHDPHWHTYWRNPGDSGLATELSLALPDGFVAGPIQWPAPQRLFIPPLANYGYEGEVVLPLELAVPNTLPNGPVRITGKAFWLMCRDVCIPGEAQIALTLPVAPAGATPEPTRHAPAFAAARARMPATALAVTVSAAGDRLSIGLDAPLQSAEFFPYREGLIANAAAQTLHALADATGPARRIELELSKDGQRAAESPEGLLQAAEGIVVAGNEVFELMPVRAAAALAGGNLVSRVEGAPTQAPGGAQGGGLSLPGLGATFGASSGAASTLALPGGRVGAGSGGGPAPGAAEPPGRGLGGLLLAAVFAAIGGLILNLMPCVFPVIGLKVLGFARHGAGGDTRLSGASRGAARAGAFAFSAGVVVSFWALAGLLIALRAAGEAAGWGFQLQSPVFVAAMALLFVAIALNFSGVWEFGASLTRLGQLEHESQGSARLGAFGSGALAVLVATPCTAPFMGSALGYTLTASVAETLLVFTALGLGMALPYLLLGLFPAWLRWLPRPGRWMESFRQALAFPMYATAAWLAWVLGQQAGIDAVLGLAIGAVLVGLAAWLVGRFVQQAAALRVAPALALRRRRVAGGLAVAALAGAGYIAWPGEPLAGADRNAGGVGEPPPGQVNAAAAWHPWSGDAVVAALDAGRPVFVDFTAAWCVSCQVNKKLVLDRDPVIAAMQRAGVLRLKADWTNRDPAITAELARHGRNGVPLYLLYLPGAAAPVVLPELLTHGIVLDALGKLGRAG